MQSTEILCYYKFSGQILALEFFFSPSRQFWSAGDPGKTVLFVRFVYFILVRFQYFIFYIIGRLLLALVFSCLFLCHGWLMNYDKRWIYQGEGEKKTEFLHASERLSFVMINASSTVIDDFLLWLTGLHVFHCRYCIGACDCRWRTCVLRESLMISLSRWGVFVVGAIDYFFPVVVSVVSARRCKNRQRIDTRGAKKKFLKYHSAFWDVTVYCQRNVKELQSASFCFTNAQLPVII